jgi:TolB protein
MIRFVILLILLLSLGACQTTVNLENDEAVDEKGLEAGKQPSKYKIAYLGYADGFWQVFTMMEDGSNRKQITKSQYDKSRISWYPDGEHLLVNSNQGGIYKVNLSTGKEQPIKTELVGMQDSVISPDGKQIVFSLSTGDSIDANNLWLMNVDGSNLHKITNMKWLQHEPTWDVKGEWIYFLSGKGGQSHDIWRVSLKNKRTEQLTVGQLYHFDVDLSTNGEMVFSSNRSGFYDIYKQKGTGSAQALTSDDSLDARPHWSPDGKRIAFESARGGVINIWLMDADGSNLRQITNNNVGARYPVWRYVQN